MSVRPTSTEALLTQVTQLQQRLQDAQMVLEQLPPEEQGQYLSNTLGQENSKLIELQEQVGILFSELTDMTDAEIISNSLGTCSSIIDGLTLKLSVPTQTVAQRNLPPAQPAPSAPARPLSQRTTLTPSPRAPAQPSQNEILRAQQDEMYQVTTFSDQCKAFVGNNDTFDKWLGQYTVMLQYSQETTFSSNDAKNQLNELISKAKKTLESKVKTQEEKEAADLNAYNQHNASAQVPELKAMLTVLEKLKELIDKKGNINDMHACDEQINNAYKTLSHDNKVKLLQAMNDLYKTPALGLPPVGRVLPPTFLAFDFTEWHGLPALKILGVQKLIPASAASAPASQKESQMMKAVILAAEEVTSNSTQTTITTSTTSTRRSTSTNPVNPSKIEESAKIEEFQKLIDSIKRQRFNDNNTGREEEFGFWKTAYSILKNYAASKNNTFVNSNTQETLAGFLAQTLQKMYDVVDKQERAESASSQPATPSSANTAHFQELKAALDQSDSQKAQAAFAKLSADEKKTFLKALCVVLKRPPVTQEVENNPDSSFNTLLKSKFNAWIGSPAQKAEALKTLIPAPSQQTQANASAQPKKSDQLRKEIEEVMTAAVAPSAPARSASRPTNPIITTTTTSTTRTSAPAPVQHPQPMEDDFQDGNTQLLKTLHNLLRLLEPNQDVNLLLSLLKSEGRLCVFPISGKAPQEMAGRPFFHLYYLHKNETPQKLKNDMEYGMKAFTNAPGFSSTAQEQQRAIQRTIVEGALQGLEDAINFGDGSSLVQFLAILENVTLDPRDKLKDADKIAYKLYGLMYNLHVEARKINGRLVDPHDRQFNNDFGKAAFRNLELNGIDPGVRLMAIDQVLSTLKEIWKV